MYDGNPGEIGFELARVKLLRVDCNIVSQERLLMLIVM